MTHEQVMHHASPNTNCLEGWQCPDCHSGGPFSVEATVQVLLYDDGTEWSPSSGDTDYNTTSSATCEACGKAATVGYFSAEEA